MLCNIFMSNCLADATAHAGVTVNSFCPGMVSSAPYLRGNNFLARLYSVLLRFVTRSDEEAAKTIVYLAGSDEVANVTGAFFADCAERKMTGLASDMGLARKIWEKSEAMVRLVPVDDPLMAAA
ncbi:retinol dehydrogenase 14-like [Penaeus japonicus]|uniref:retinol dehydrogenase 14-like n=1 Tax=Penaeus japonicus TaxID=27405 RepID=UPI001C715E7E|nr:retinol dehydrogenase 14-like [Penaeus japonicus]